jgi:hypothetical protein
MQTVPVKGAFRNSPGISRVMLFRYIILTIVLLGESRAHFNLSASLKP